MCRTGDDVAFKGAILRTCVKRNNKHAEDVRFRVEGAIRDTSAEVRYYVDSRARFMTTTHIKAAAAPTCTESNAYDVFLSHVTEYDVIKGKKMEFCGKTVC